MSSGYGKGTTEKVTGKREQKGVGNREQKLSQLIQVTLFPDPLFPVPYFSKEVY
ncbi:MAG: hypothetical protein F6K56_38455 [Moorea sp. SIO3G5]|nr:hypothetical protein [Moorena sp. SIO3G5]